MSVLLLAGCGSGSSESTTAPETSSRASTSPAPSGPSGTPSTPRSKGSGEARAAQPPYEGAEEEIEQLGSEASGNGREAVVGVEREYLKAVSQQDFAKACALLAGTTRMQLQQLVRGKKVDCAAILPRLLGAPAASTAHVYLEGELRKVRVSGDKAFVIFHAPGARLFLIGLVDEGGHWRVGNLAPSVLAPSRAALEG